jgi:hypothetical protein
MPRFPDSGELTDDNARSRSMSAVTGRSAPSIATASYCGISTLVVAVGVAGLFEDSWLNRILPYPNTGKWLFGTLLCCLVLVRFYWRIKHCWPILTADLRVITRELSRMVYLILYSVVGLTQLSRGSLEAPQGLQAYLAYALLALILIRVLAALCNRIAATAARDQPRDDPPQPARSAM